MTEGCDRTTAVGSSACPRPHFNQLLGLLALLERNLRDSRRAAARFDMDVMERHTADISRVCDQLLTLRASLLPIASREQLDAAAARVTAAANSYGALVRKSRRTLNILANVWATSAPAYLPPEKSVPSVLGL